MMVQVVPTSSVSAPPGAFIISKIKSFKETLERQGLIEPLIVKEVSPGKYETTEHNWYDHSYLQAAKELGWDTVIICLESEVD